jgi:hypothetical protein
VQQIENGRVVMSPATDAIVTARSSLAQASSIARSSPSTYPVTVDLKSRSGKSLRASSGRRRGAPLDENSLRHKEAHMKVGVVKMNLVPFLVAQIAEDRVLGSLGFAFQSRDGRVKLG